VAPEGVYNMDETISCLLCPTNKTVSATKSSWAQNSGGVSHSRSCYKHDMHWQVETCDYLQICTPKMLCMVVANMWWFANQMAQMTSNVFESWMMSLNV